MSNPLLDLSARLVIGHRGNSAHAPENTIESFEQAVALGVDAIEFDVRVTREGVPVVIHDASLARTTRLPELVSTLTVSELERADAGAMFTPDAGSTFPYRGRGLRVPRLADVLERFRGLPKIIEVKVPEAVDATRSAIRAAGALGEVLVDSSDDAAVSPFRDGTMATGSSMREIARLLRRCMLPGSATQLPYEAICIPRFYNGIPIPVRQLARIVRGAGVTTHVWTINSAGVAVRLWRSGVQGIISDDPGGMIQARRELVSR